jgi:hypothetical protein
MKGYYDDYNGARNSSILFPRNAISFVGFVGAEVYPKSPSWLGVFGYTSAPTNPTNDMAFLGKRMEEFLAPPDADFDCRCNLGDE